MHLRIGILGGSDGWKSLLQQVGVSHSVVENTMLPNEFSAAVVGDEINDRESEMLRQYLALGGAVLCSAKVYSRIRSTTTHSEFVEYIHARQSNLIRPGSIIDLHAYTQLPWNANHGTTNRGSLALFSGQQSKEILIALPFDPSSLVFDQRAETKSFYSPERRLPFESVSLISKGEIRSLITDCLESLHHRRGIPFVHLWHIPSNAPSLFCLRIDTDYGTDEHMEQLSKIIHQHGISATWFVDAKSHMRSLKQYREMHKQEIGIHCFEHQTFPDYERNMQNIRGARNILAQAKLTTAGFAAPYGMWNENLGRAIVDSGFEYSSEFSYDYDDVPMTPLLQKGSGVLQVPIHPICVGNLKRQGYDDADMIRYFEHVVQRKLVQREPIVLYHHPKDGHLPVLAWMFKEIRKNRLPNITMHEYAQWWKHRVESIPDFRLTREHLHMRGFSRDKSLCVHITQPDGKEAFVPLSKQMTLAAIRWKIKPGVWTEPVDYMRSRQFNYRIPLIRGLDAVTNFLRHYTT